LKTAERKLLQVRVLSPPLFFIGLVFRFASANQLTGTGLAAKAQDDCADHDDQHTHYSKIEAQADLYEPQFIDTASGAARNQVIDRWCGEVCRRRVDKPGDHKTGCSLTGRFVDAAMLQLRQKML
jgi:hypothetical protein